MYLKPRLLLPLVVGLFTLLVLFYFTQADTALPQSNGVTDNRKHNDGATLQSAPSSTTMLTPPTATKPEVETPTSAKIKPRIDWQKYPGTLAEQIQRALEQANGVMAEDLAQKLFECETIQRSLAPENYQHTLGAPINASDEIKKSVAQQYQRINSYCQTVAGDFTKLRLRLLDVAIKDNIIGAAEQSFHLGVRKPEVLQSILRDAKAGDLNSITLMSYQELKVLEIDEKTQATLRYALVLAAQNSAEKSRSKFNLDLAETTAAFLRGEKPHKFDYAGLDETARNQAKEIATQLTKKLNESE